MEVYLRKCMRAAPELNCCVNARTYPVDLVTARYNLRQNANKVTKPEKIYPSAF